MLVEQTAFTIEPSVEPPSFRKWAVFETGATGGVS